MFGTVSVSYNQNAVVTCEHQTLYIEYHCRCGFYTNHCFEALLRTNNDLESAIEILLRHYFSHAFLNVPATNFLKNTAEMDEELSSLRSIYEEIVEERVQYKHWVFHLELMALAEWYFAGSNDQPKVIPLKQTTTSSKPLCRYYNLGKCSYGSRCRFQHVKNSEELKQNSVNNSDLKLKAKFDLEIRFPDGEYFGTTFETIVECSCCG